MRKVLITGGSKGIGKAVSLKFKEKGYEVIEPSHQELDLADGESVRRFTEKYQDTYFNAIVNNAGINDLHEIGEITDGEIEEMFAVNLITPIKLLRAFTGQMKEHHYGRIVNIGSIWAVVSKAGRCVYSATKNGIHGVTNTLAVELAADNILVNTVCPGFTLTELTRKNNTKEQMMRIAESIPMARMAEPEEIAEVVYFLCSDNNTYLTGQKITVDGGFTIQ